MAATPGGGVDGGWEYKNDLEIYIDESAQHGEASPGRSAGGIGAFMSFNIFADLGKLL
jgi:hypothetical protein